MRLTLPKADKKDSSGDTGDYQQGYAVQPDYPSGNGNGGYDDGGGNGNDDKSRRRHRVYAFGCLLTLLVIVVACFAFIALNQTTKQPIDDPYEYVEPDTANFDTLPAIEEPVETDTVEVHHELPKTIAEPADSADVETEGTGEEEAGTPDPADGSAEAVPAGSDKEEGAKEQTSKSKKTEKSHEESAASKEKDNVKAK